MDHIIPKNKISYLHQCSQKVEYSTIKRYGEKYIRNKNIHVSE